MLVVRAKHMRGLIELMVYARQQVILMWCGYLRVRTSVAGI